MGLIPQKSCNFEADSGEKSRICIEALWLQFGTLKIANRRITDELTVE